MALLEFSVVPLGEGASVSAQVAECVDIVDKSGLPYEVHAMGTVVEGGLDEVLGVMRQCIEHVAAQGDRVSCSAKIDHRPGASGQLSAKLSSVEAKLGRPLRRGGG